MARFSFTPIRGLSSWLNLQGSGCMARSATSSFCVLRTQKRRQPRSAPLQLRSPSVSQERLQSIGDALGWGAVATDWARLKGDDGAVLTLELEESGSCMALYVMARPAGEGVGYAWLHLRKVVVSRIGKSIAVGGSAHANAACR